MHDEWKVMTMASYVKRTNDVGRVGWVGPIRSPRQAVREVEAWESCGWSAEVVPVTPESRLVVRSWSKASRLARQS